MSLYASAQDDGTMERTFAEMRDRLTPRQRAAAQRIVADTRAAHRQHQALIDEAEAALERARERLW